MVLKTVRRNLLRDRFAAKRDPRRLRSLDALRACHDPRLEGWLEEPAAPVFQVAEVEGFWSTLSPADRDLLDRRRTQSVAAIARTLGLSRHDIQRRFAQLQRQARQAGLTDDLVK